MVEALRDGEIIVLVKGGREGLIAELSELMGGYLASVPVGLGQRAVFGEVTSTFGDEAADEAVEQLVDAIAEALMDSEHVEDVFAEDKVLRRDTFRVVRDGLLSAVDDADDGDDEEQPAASTVRLEALGYVAKSVASLADEETLRDVLERAADDVDAELVEYDPAKLEATFAFADDDPDARLELEQAIADEFEGLVEMGFVDLPTIERRLTLLREVPREERPSLKPAIDAASAASLQASACGVSWMFLGTTTLSVTFTPLAELPVSEIDSRFKLFAQAVEGLVGGAPKPAKKAEAKAPAKKAEVARKAPAKKAATKTAKKPRKP